MKIAYTIAGAGGMYCGACIRDNTVVRALRAGGCDVVAIPLYTPIRADGPDETIGQVYYGGLNVYLQQQSRLFGRLPRFLGRLLDSPRLLRAAGKLAAKTDPAAVGELMISVLQGREGRQAKELDRLIAFLRDEVRPDILHLPNTLLAGMAGPIKEALGVRVVASLQGEDFFTDSLPEPHRSRAKDILRRKVRDVEAFISPGRAYAAHMARYLDVTPASIHVVPPGLDTTGYPTAPTPPPVTPTVGFFARIAPEKGLHLLADAFVILRKMPGTENCRLLVGGWLGTQHRPYFRDVQRQLANAGLLAEFEYVGELDLAGKIEFLCRLTVLSVPSPQPPSKGLYVLESLACGVPVVLPDHGIFPELIEATGGGVLVRPDDPAALAEGLHGVLTRSAKRQLLSEAGHRAVHRSLTAAAMAEGTLRVYSQLAPE